MAANLTFTAQSYYQSLYNYTKFDDDVIGIMANELLSHNGIDQIQLTLAQKVRNAFLGSIPFLNWRDTQTDSLQQALENNTVKDITIAITNGARKLSPSELVDRIEEDGKLSDSIGTYLSLVDFDAYHENIETIFKYNVLRISIIALSALCVVSTVYFVFSLTSFLTEKKMLLFLDYIKHLHPILSFLCGFSGGFFGGLLGSISGGILGGALNYSSKLFKHYTSMIGEIRQDFYETFNENYLNHNSPDDSINKWKLLLKEKIKRDTLEVDIDRIKNRHPSLISLNQIPSFQEVIREFENEERELN